MNLYSYYFHNHFVHNAHERHKISKNNWKIVSISIICEYCGDEFDGEFYEPYCSKQCTGKACGFALEIRKCKACGLEFQTLTNDKYCSFECTYELLGILTKTVPGI